MSDTDHSTILKRCGDCGLPKPIDSFYRKRKGSDERASRCKRCDNRARNDHYREQMGVEPAHYRDVGVMPRTVQAVFPAASPLVARPPKCRACLDDPRRVNGGTCAACGLARRA